MKIEIVSKRVNIGAHEPAKSGGFSRAFWHNLTMGKFGKSFTSLVLAISIASSLPVSAIGMDWSLNLVEHAPNGVSNLTFGTAMVDGPKVIVRDDDGMATLAYLQYNMMQGVHEDLYMGKTTWAVAKETVSETFAKYKPAVLASLKRIVASDSDVLKTMNQELLVVKDDAAKQKLKTRIAFFTREQENAMRIYGLLDKDGVKVGEISEELGSFMQNFGRYHVYTNNVQGKEVPNLPLFGGDGSNPIGALMSGRMLRITDDKVGGSRSRSDLDIKPEIVNGLVADVSASVHK